MQVTILSRQISLRKAIITTVARAHTMMKDLSSAEPAHTAGVMPANRYRVYCEVDCEAD